MGRDRRSDRASPSGDDGSGRPVGSPPWSAATAALLRTWPASWAVTGTPSWMRSSTTGRRWSTIPPGSGRSPPSGWTRRCSLAAAGGAPSTGVPRSSTSAVPPSRLTSPRVAPPPAQPLNREPACRVADPDRVGRVGPVGPVPQDLHRSAPLARGQSCGPVPRGEARDSKLDACRRRGQQETLGHRDGKADALYRSRRLLTTADVRGRARR